MVPPPEVQLKVQLADRAKHSKRMKEIDREITDINRKAHSSAQNAKMAGGESKFFKKEKAKWKAEQYHMLKELKREAPAALQAGTKPLKSLLMSAAQQCCNPHDSLHIQTPLLLPVNGDTPTSVFCDVDNVVADYPVDGNSSGIPSSQAVAICFSDYVRNSIIYRNCPGSGSKKWASIGDPAAVGGPSRSCYRLYGTDQDGGTKGFTPKTNPRRALSMGIYVPFRFDYAAPDITQGTWTPHGPLMGVARSTQSELSYFWCNKGDVINTDYYNNWTGAQGLNQVIFRYSPEGAIFLNLLSGPSVATGASSSIYHVVPFEGYYAVAHSSTAVSTTMQIGMSITNAGPTNLVSSDYCWAHIPAPGFVQVGPMMEAGRVNGTVLEYHNTGSVTNGQVYAGQFDGVEWNELVGQGFAAFQAQTKDNEIAQTEGKALGGLVRIPLAPKTGDDLVAAHKHLLGSGITYAAFYIDNPGPFCVLWTTILAGNLGAPQNAVWKRGINLQFTTFDTTRFTGVSDLSQRDYNMMKTIVSRVPYWGSNDLHWSEVTGFLHRAMNFAESALPYAKGLLSLI